MLLSAAEYDIIYFVETYLRQDDISAKCVIGYHGIYDLFRYDRPSGFGGVAAVYFKRVLNPVHVSLSDHYRAIEAVCLDLKIVNCTRVVCIYRPPNSTIEYD